MAMMAIGLFEIYTSIINKKFANIEKYIIYVSITAIIASLWFIAAYWKHGPEFFDYFFLRENLGKFGSEKMESRKILQGLLLYSLPWSLWIPSVLKKSTFKNETTLFLLFGFISFFFIWFIPSQKSHHYAVPSIPFFLAIIVSSIPEKPNLFQKVTSLIFVSLLMTPVLFMNFIVPFPDAAIATGTIILLTTLVLLLKTKNSATITGLITVTMLYIYSIVAPKFYLPNFPTQFISLTQNSKMALVDRRSFFFEEVLDQNVEPIEIEQLDNFLSEPNSKAIVYQSRLGTKDISNYHVLASWKKWIRDITTKHITSAIKSHNITMLQEDVFLIENKQTQP